MTFANLYNNIVRKCTIDIINATYNKYIEATYMSSYNIVHQHNTYYSIINYTRNMRDIK
jgi:hypothetical protein